MTKTPITAVVTPAPAPEPIPPADCMAAVAMFRSLGYRVESLDSRGVMMVIRGPRLVRSLMAIAWLIARGRDVGNAPRVVRWLIFRQPTIWVTADTPIA